MDIDKQANEDFVNKLLDLFETRDETYRESTEEILECIRGNILDAFDDVLELPSNQIQWLDIVFDIDEREVFYLILTFQISYYGSQANNYIKNNFGLETEDGEEETARVITFGIPAILAHLPKESIKNFILEKDPLDIKKKDDKDYDFDLSLLSDLQQSQIKLFSKGTIH